jgi:hypothetical protein
MNRFFLMLVPILIVPLLATSRGQLSSTAKPQPQKTVLHASWTPALEKSSGITEQEFRSMGLRALTTQQFTALFEWIEGRGPQAKDLSPHASWMPTLEQNFDISQQGFQDMGLGALTTDQFVNLFVWVSTREQKAKDSVPRQTYDCGRTGTPFQAALPEAYDKVRVYVSATGEANQIISGVRERLRTMNGTEVVYAEDEADLSVSLLAMNVETVGGNRTGVAVAVEVTLPCAMKLGTDTIPYAMHQNQFLQVGSDVSSVVNDIVSTIDTSDLEGQRKMNARYKKVLQDQKK